jgi:hypothetical protein
MMKRRLIILIAAGCPPTSAPTNQSSYIKVFPLSGGEFWHADRLCKFLNSTMVTPKSTAENDLFLSLINASYTSNKYGLIEDAHLIPLCTNARLNI